MRKSFEATLLLSGMIIGVGMFGIPFVFARAGFLLGALELLILTGVIAAVHMLYGEVVLHTSGRHRLPGYARLYLGRMGARVAWFTTLFGNFGTLLLYLIAGGIFLKTLLAHVVLVPAGVPVLAMAVVGAVVTFSSFRGAVRANSVLTIILIGFMLLLVVRLVPFVRAEELFGFHPREVGIPYGVLLFALSGGIVVPDVLNFLGGTRRAARHVLLAGSLIPAFLYLLFAATIVGVAGRAVSEEAIGGLLPFVGPEVVLLGSAIGLLAVLTSLIAVSESFQILLTVDFGLPRRAAWCAVVGVPLALYLLRVQDFTKLLGLIGAVEVGINAVVILSMYLMLRRRKAYIVPWWAVAGVWIVGAMVLAGVGYQLIILFR
ncbi:MAG: aromatic amino acid transport family protein [bacterium]|nr:aromatic amino acid transport family protein [bacterium]MDZ4299624.1 aromatic amino acid transport family protein [Candidatus Sungbacteria bacterium]